MTSIDGTVEQKSPVEDDALESPDVLDEAAEPALEPAPWLDVVDDEHPARARSPIAKGTAARVDLTVNPF